MSEKDAQPRPSKSLADVVADNVRWWRQKRRLDQQELADRLRELGWPIDRTSINRIENKQAKQRRKVTVEDLGYLAVALNVPMGLLLVPIQDDASVRITAAGLTASTSRWWVWEWLTGDAVPFDRDNSGDYHHELQSGIEPLSAYRRLDSAARAIWTYWQVAPAGEMEGIGLRENSSYRGMLQDLVDVVQEMEEMHGLPAQDLIDEPAADDIKTLGITPSTLEQLERSGRVRGLGRLVPGDLRPAEVDPEERALAAGAMMILKEAAGSKDEVEAAGGDWDQHLFQVAARPDVQLAMQRATHDAVAVLNRQTDELVSSIVTSAVEPIHQMIAEALGPLSQHLDESLEPLRQALTAGLSAGFGRAEAVLRADTDSPIEGERSD